MTESERTATESLANVGPGGFCEDCGHVAERHWGDFCAFPYVDKYCNCAGMKWQGERVDMRLVTDIVAAGR